MMPFRYSWLQCVAGDDTCFAGTDGLLQFGWISLSTSCSNEGSWKYYLDGLRFPGFTVRGHVDGTPRDAAAFLEDEYDRRLPLAVGLDMKYEDEAQHFIDRGLPVPPMVQWRKAVPVDHSMTAAEADVLFRPDFKPFTGNTTHSRRSRR